MKLGYPRRMGAVLTGVVIQLEVHAGSTIEFAMPTTVSVVENVGAAVLTVLRTGDLESVATVDFATNDGTAKAGSDFTATSGTLTFEPGDTNRLISVPIVNDAWPESTERFSVRLSNPSANAVLGPAPTTQISITDNDAGIQVEFANYWADEGSEAVTIAVTRGEAEDFPATVDYRTADGTARAGSDYETVAGTLTFAADEKLKLVVIGILNDGQREASETFNFGLANPTGATALGTVESATITITDNDPGVHLDRSQYWIAEDEGPLVVEARRGNDSNREAFTVMGPW